MMSLNQQPLRVVSVRPGENTGDNIYRLEDGSIWKTLDPFAGERKTGERRGKTDGVVHYEKKITVTKCSPAIC